MGEGEQQEGQIWEAVAEAAKFELDNLRVIVDVNGQQCDGCIVPEVHVEPLPAKIEAFGGSAIEVDGHNLSALDAAMSKRTRKPHFVLALTDPTRGVPLMAERHPMLHYLRFTSADERKRYEAAYEGMVT